MSEYSTYRTMYKFSGKDAHFIISWIKIEYAIGNGSVYVSVASDNIYIKRGLRSIFVTTSLPPKEKAALLSNVQKFDFDGLHTDR